MRILFVCQSALTVAGVWFSGIEYTSGRCMSKRKYSLCCFSLMPPERTRLMIFPTVPVSSEAEQRNMEYPVSVITVTSVPAFAPPFSARPDPRSSSFIRSASNSHYYGMVFKQDVFEKMDADLNGLADLETGSVRCGCLVLDAFPSGKLHLTLLETG